MIFVRTKDLNPEEMADYGLHLKIIDIIKSKSLKKDSKVLVLGSGKGGIERILINEGFRDITSVDINDENYDAFLYTNFIKANLNESFDFTDKKYDLIIAVEVIEHLYSTRHFLEETKKKLKKKGLLILTTPNILRKTSIAQMLVLGTFAHFSKNALSYGHINPIFPHILKYHLKELNLEINNENYNRKEFDVLVIDNWKSYFIYGGLWLLSNIIKLISLRKDYMEGVISIFEISIKE
jgi:cyclopropane fatty-acyl-phospholipid synthase-like methyltransferase